MKYSWISNWSWYCVCKNAIIIKNSTINIFLFESFPKNGILIPSCEWSLGYHLKQCTCQTVPYSVANILTPHMWPDLPKGSNTCTVLRYTFHCHLLATSMDQQHMCVILLKVEQSAFTQAFFSSLSDIHECSAGLQMAPSSLGKQTADWIIIQLADTSML